MRGECTAPVLQPGYVRTSDQGHPEVATVFGRPHSQRRSQPADHIEESARPHDQDFFLAAALPPFRPASFFCAVVPPCLGELPEPLFLPPRLDAPGEFAIRAARSLDMPFSLRASYWSSFFTLGRLLGMPHSFG